MFKEFWDPLGSAARAGLIAGALLIVAMTAGAWLFRTDYQVLFADLKPQDTAMMVAELERLKVPYRIGADGNTLLVEGNVVHATRLKLMGKDIPLHGAAGFELFNNADFGMTEFAQKINYQRALQGELTRTILSLSEVRDVRVHLALPEEGLFKRASSNAKAAITLSLKAGQSLRPEQINGIQRLVSAAVPGVVAQDVTIVDQQGVALTRTVPVQGDPESGSGRLDLKRDTERMLARKATEVLERAFGAGQAVASVDVTLNMDQVRVTTEDVLGAPARPGQGAATGVMVRERETARDAGPPLGGRDAAGRGSNSQREVEYQVGRRVEQVATQPGAIRRLHVVAVIRQAMDDKQIDQMRVLVAAAVGALPERGDSVVVQSLRAFLPSDAHDAAGVSSPDEGGPMPSAETMAAPPSSNTDVIAILALLLVAVLAAGAGWIVWRRTRTGSRKLTPVQREALLEQMRDWLDDTAGAPAPAARRDTTALGARS